MRPLRRRIFGLLALLALSPPAPASDLLLENGMVYASASAAPQSASIVVRDGKVAFVGDPARARALAKDARAVDLNGRFVFPGLADAHLHLLGIGKALEIANLRGAADAKAAAARMAAVAAKLPAGAWVEGRGWNQN